MGDLPRIGNTTRRSVTITIPPYWADHHFQGRAILPAVDAMQLLAHWVRGAHPHLDANIINQARFNKFLPLPPGRASIDACCETAEIDAGGVRAALITLTAGRTQKIKRALVHAQLDLGSPSREPADAAYARLPEVDDPAFLVQPERIYAELVPFGPGYRNLTRPLQLWPQGALAHILAPALIDGQTALPLGSPFVLDAAFHAACVWSQRYAGVVAFPVGIGQRMVHRPTRTGDRYRASIVPVEADRSHLAFDICITDLQGRLFEEVHDVRMRDVSGGRLSPPHWIVTGHKGPGKRAT